ncbi:TadE/TadG family type IV pilus assembly protein [Mesorhizobium sp. CN2-181]|uniref:TadE/TadG family type IV pilus assembly protein n=1 Tax=Mesorhizobium yinganensis TaxID=3157707 RepID=UPI0032B7F0ED
MLRRFLVDERGNLAAIFTIASVPILAGVAMAVDYSSISTKASNLQNSLDATALAIATKYFSGMTHQQLQQLGNYFFSANLYGDKPPSDLELEFTDQVSALEVDATASGQDYYIKVGSNISHEGMIAGRDTLKAWREAYVKILVGPPACALALDEHASSAFKLQGSTQVRFDGCVIAANSDAADAVSRGGSAQLAAECVTTVGQTLGLRTSNTDLVCPSPYEKQLASMDPLANVVPPSYTGCLNVPNGKTKKLSPGTYCDRSISGEVTLEPGVYILRGGKINLGGNGKLMGSGVTIFLMEGAEFSSNGNEIVNLSPPTTGPYAGVTIYQAANNDKPLVINGTSGSNVDGFIYAPGAPITYAGTADMTAAGKCLRLVGKTIEMTGNSKVGSNCEDVLGGRKMYAGRILRLVK